MSSKNVAVFGIYSTPGTAEAAVDHLLANGFTNSAISVLLPDDESTRAFAHEKAPKLLKAQPPGPSPAESSVERLACSPASALSPFPASVLSSLLAPSWRPCWSLASAAP